MANDCRKKIGGNLYFVPYADRVQTCGLLLAPGPRFSPKAKVSFVGGTYFPVVMLAGCK